MRSDPTPRASTHRVPAAAASLAVLVLACGPSGEAEKQREADAERLHRRAIQMLSDRDSVGSYRLFRAIPSDTRAGRRAEADLRRADREYRAGLALLEEGRDEEARGRFDAARRIAPMDPRLYRRLGKAFELRGTRSGRASDFQKAADYYSKAAAYFEERPPAEPGQPGVGAASRIAWIVGGALVVVLLAVLGWVRVLRRGETLEELVEKSPEMHPQVAYLVGALRHELLKHRIGAVSDALAALRTPRTSPAEIEYLAGRLFGGEPIVRVWETHLDGFERASGGRLNLRHRDGMFRRAGRALRAIARMKRELSRPDPKLARRLGRHHAEVRGFDRWLRSLADRLCLAQVDSALLREVVYAVQQEHAAGAVHIDEIRYPDVPAGVHVEVFRTDLVIILKNVVRNAILAMAEEPPRRVLGLDVRIEPEPTGEETVVLVVYDTSRQRLTTEAIYERRLDRGLGLVTAALARYEGSISVEEGTDGFAKGVALRFFRALRETESRRPSEV